MTSLFIAILWIVLSFSVIHQCKRQCGSGTLNVHWNDIPPATLGVIFYDDFTLLGNDRFHLTGYYGFGSGGILNFGVNGMNGSPFSHYSGKIVGSSAYGTMFTSFPFQGKCTSGTWSIK